MVTQDLPRYISVPDFPANSQEVAPNFHLLTPLDFMAGDCWQQLPPTSCVEGLLDWILDLVFITHQLRSILTRLPTLFEIQAYGIHDLQAIHS